MKTETDYPLPLVHSNGTGFKTLSEDYEIAADKLEEFIDAWANIEFNARDYYVIDSDAYSKARDKRDEMNARIRAIKEYILQHRISILEQKK